MAESSDMIDKMFAVVMQFFVVYGPNTALVIMVLGFFGFSLYFIYNLAKAKLGMFQSPEERALDLQERNNSYLRENFMQSWEKILDILLRIERNQDSKLSVSQVDTLVHYYISSFTNDMVERMVDIYVDEDLTHEGAVIARINSHLSTITLNADQRYFSLPNTHSAMVETNSKIEGLLDKGLAYSLYDTLTTAKSERAVRCSCKTVIINYIVQNWKMR